MRILLISIVLFLIGCGSTLPDQSENFLMDNEYSIFDTRGAWVDVKQMDGSLEAGELIAIKNDSLYILNGITHRLAILHYSQVRVLKLRKGKSPANLVRKHATAGTVSTLGHGIFLPFSGCAWIGTGWLVGSIYDKLHHVKYPSRKYSNLNDLASYARFSGGLPDDLNLDRVKKANIPKTIF